MLLRWLVINLKSCSGLVKSWLCQPWVSSLLSINLKAGSSLVKCLHIHETSIKLPPRESLYKIPANSRKTNMWGNFSDLWHPTSALFWRCPPRRRVERGVSAPPTPPSVIGPGAGRRLVYPSKSFVSGKRFKSLMYRGVRRPDKNRVEGIGFYEWAFFRKEIKPKRRGGRS